MQSFLNKVGKTAGAAMNKAGSKAGELLEVSKLKAKISSEKQSMNSVKRDIGDYCYSLFVDDKIDDKRIKEYCEQIRNHEATIEDLQQQIDDVKEEYRAKSDEADEAADEDEHL